MGTSFDTLQEVARKDLVDPLGWFDVALCTGEHAAHVFTFMVQITVLQNYQNGKDTHVRAIKLWQSTDPFEE